MEVRRNVSKRTKRIKCVHKLSYEDRMKSLGLCSLANRRIYLDLVLLYRIVFNLCPIPFDKFFTFSTTNTVSRGHQFKLMPRQCRTDIFKYFFTNRVISHWNNLPTEIVSCGSISTFKRRISKISFNLGWCLHYTKLCINRMFNDLIGWILEAIGSGFHPNFFNHILES